MVGVIKVRAPSKIGVLLSAETSKKQCFRGPKARRRRKKIGVFGLSSNNPPLLSTDFEQGGGVVARNYTDRFLEETSLFSTDATRLAYRAKRAASF